MKAILLFLVLSLGTLLAQAHEEGHGTDSEIQERYNQRAELNSQYGIELDYAKEVQRECEVIGGSAKECLAEYYLRKCIDSTSEECEGVKFTVKIPVKKTQRIYFRDTIKYKLLHSNGFIFKGLM